MTYYQKNREKILEKSKEFRTKNPDVIRERRKRYVEKNREKIREKKKKTRRHRYLKQTYGISEKEFEEIKLKQQGKCAICGIENKPLQVDHCHSTGEIRELLCHHCNSGLGNFFDNVNVLQKAIDYVRKHKPVG